ncbi:MAG: hypothetical protein PHD31_00380 [Candidatus Pacebacteria bacterium]|nr:hypothetical protein [Candidatus Paceibacterota bacterium]
MEVLLELVEKRDFVGQETIREVSSAMDKVSAAMRLKNAYSNDGVLVAEVYLKMTLLNLADVLEKHVR